MSRFAKCSVCKVERNFEVYEEGVKLPDSTTVVLGLVCCQHCKTAIGVHDDQIWSSLFSKLDAIRKKLGC